VPIIVDVDDLICAVVNTRGNVRCRTDLSDAVQKIAKRDPFSGKVVTGGIVTAKDSSWLLSWTVNQQPHFKQQPKDQIVVWVYALFVEQPGDYVKKPMQDCTGEEITQEWLYHLGVPVQDIPELGATGRLRDGKEINIPGPHFVRNLLMNKLDKTRIGALLREFGLVTGD
jgi:myosin-crossreactive antigen